jgi:DNA-binding NarL/FixJ family response regulator
MEKSAPIRVMLVEDNEALRESQFHLIDSAEGYSCVAAFEDAESAVAVTQNVKPDVALVDIHFGSGKMDGIEATRRIKEIRPSTLIVIQTLFQDDEKVLKAIMAGADGYVVKGASNDMVLDIIRRVVSHDPPMTPGVATKVLKMLRQSQQARPRMLKGRIIPDDIRLTPIQERILEMLIQGKAYKIMADNLGMSIDALRYHVKEIYKQLRNNDDWPGM